MTTFADQLFHLGGIPVGAGTLPVMGYDPIGEGAQTFYVHGYLGLDGNDGKTPGTALKTLTAAYALCKDGRGDVVYILNDGSTTATVRDVALTWAKDNCHIVGLGAPSINQRVRIAPPSADTVDVDAYTPYFTLSATGCIISNVCWYQGNSEDTKPSVGVKVTGHRNYFHNVSIITGAAAHQGDEELCYQLQLCGSENVFEKCYIGQDTAARSAANANVRFGSSADDESSRNVFRECIFPMWADAATPVFIKNVGLTDIQRWNLFDRCVFINTGTSTLTEGVSIAGSSTGKIFLKDCGFYGCTDVTAADSTLVFCQGPAAGVAVEVGMFKGVDIA